MKKITSFKFELLAIILLKKITCRVPFFWIPAERWGPGLALMRFQPHLFLIIKEELSAERLDQGIGTVRHQLPCLII
jgi:hypothetical protein